MTDSDRSATAPQAAENGQPEQPVFPMQSFEDAARHLRRPFTAAAVKFKVQATWPKDNPTGGLIVAYIDARLVVERLNLILPASWHDAYRPIGNRQMWCDLTVDGITRSDVGEGQGKGLVSDALKRAAVKFGIGVSLYAIPKMILETKDACLKQKRGPKGPTLELAPQGEKVLRLMYAQWLDQHGVQAFGEALDHGDVADAQGDHEAGDDENASEGPSEAPAGVDADTGEVVGLTDSEVAAMEEVARSLVERNLWTGAKLKSHLVAAGASDTSSVAAALRTLSREQGEQLGHSMADLLAKADENGSQS